VVRFAAVARSLAASREIQVWLNAVMVRDWGSVKPAGKGRRAVMRMVGVCKADGEAVSSVVCQCGVVAVWGMGSASPYVQRLKWQWSGAVEVEFFQAHANSRAVTPTAQASGERSCSPA